jgi:hypothetical protein
LCLPREAAITVWKLRRLLEPRTIALPVDCGHVRCPARAADVDIDRCVDCTFLREVMPDAQHHAMQIICQPPLASMRGAGLE